MGAEGEMPLVREVAVVRAEVDAEAALAAEMAQPSPEAADAAARAFARPQAARDDLFNLIGLASAGMLARDLVVDTLRQESEDEEDEPARESPPAGPPK